MEVLVVEDRLELTAATIGGYIIFRHRQPPSDTDVGRYAIGIPRSGRSYAKSINRRLILAHISVIVKNISKISPTNPGYFFAEITKKTCRST
jgi:hypothetical protein